MPKRILSVALVLLLSHLAVADEDLPDLEKVVEEHKALLESIRTGRITYIEERTRGTDDLEEFKKYYRGELEEGLRKAKAAAPDNRMIAFYQRQLYDYDASAAKELMSGTTRHRITCVFDKDAGAVKNDRRDLRDIAAMMGRWGLPGEPHRYRWTSSSRLSRDAHKILSPPRGDSPPRLSIYKGSQDQLPISPLHHSGLLQISTAERYAEEGFEVESRRVYRDAENPGLIIEEVIFSPMALERAPLVRDGEPTSTMIPREEPLTRKVVTVHDESAHFRKVSRVVYENDRRWLEFLYEYASDEVFWLPTTLKFHWYHPDGSVVRTSTTLLESVELNVEIAADELELDIPPGTITTDYRGDKPLTPVVVQQVKIFRVK